MGKEENLSGRRFGRLAAKEVAGKSGKKTLWLCLCDCGRFTVVRADQLKSGNTRSCGCLSKDTARATFTTHGKSQHTKLYKVWTSMKQRCTNPNSQNYHRYGGRGIAVCQEWAASFECFYDWAISSGYQDGLEIDRIDNNGGYDPENCHWVTHKVNANNREIRR